MVIMVDDGVEARLNKVRSRLLRSTHHHLLFSASNQNNGRLRQRASLYKSYHETLVKIYNGGGMKRNYREWPIIENGRDTATTPSSSIIAAVGAAIIAKGADLVGCRFWLCVLPPKSILVEYRFWV